MEGMKTKERDSDRTIRSAAQAAIKILLAAKIREGIRSPGSWAPEHDPNRIGNLPIWRPSAEVGLSVRPITMIRDIPASREAA
jgi:hypothetical protein